MPIGVEEEDDDEEEEETREAEFVGGPPFPAGEGENDNNASESSSEW